MESLAGCHERLDKQVRVWFLLRRSASDVFKVRTVLVFGKLFRCYMLEQKERGEDSLRRHPLTHSTINCAIILPIKQEMRDDHE